MKRSNLTNGQSVVGWTGAKAIRTLMSITIAAGLLTGISATNAVSGAFVTEWGYQLDAGFFDYVPVSNVVSSDPNPVLGGGTGFPTEIAWGDEDDPPSSFQVDPTTDGQVTGMLMTTEMMAGDPLNFETGNVFIHNNNAISDEPFLTFTRLREQLMLSPLQAEDHDGNPLTMMQISLLPQPLIPPAPDFELFYLETDNEGPCTIAGPAMGDLCRDVLAVEPPDGIAVSQVNGDIILTSMFVYAQHLYNVHFKLSGLEFLGPGTCAATGASANCVGVVSDEGGSNTFQAMLAIEHKGKIPVSEPGALVIFSLGLVGLGYLRRRLGA